MRTIQLTAANLLPAADKLEGQFLDVRHYDRVIDDSATVLKPDGTPLLIYIKDALPRSLCDVAFNTFKDVTLRSDNRGMGGPRFRPIKRDGTRSRTTQAPPVNSGVVGVFDREPRTPYCRMTAFTGEHPAAFESIKTFIIAASRTFQVYAPDRWEVQRSFARSLSPDFVIRDTVFTTMTINKSVRTRAHKDRGDYRPGFGVMAALEGGHYAGCELIFPKYRTAVDMRTGGLCLADVHELHGNAPLVVRPPNQRLSFVFYVREKMAACSTCSRWPTPRIPSAS